MPKMCQVCQAHGVVKVQYGFRVMDQVTPTLWPHGPSRDPCLSEDYRFAWTRVLCLGTSTLAVYLVGPGFVLCTADRRGMCDLQLFITGCAVSYVE